MQPFDTLMQASGLSSMTQKSQMYPFAMKFLPTHGGSFEIERVLSKRKRAPTAVVKSLGLEDLRPHFSKPLQEAATALNISANSLKRTARRLGIPRWPYRGLKGLVRSKKEVVRGMSTCGNESDKRDVLRKQYCALSTKEAQLRQKGAVNENGDEVKMDGENTETKAEDGLDALAEAAQAHSVSNDDASGEDESQESHHSNKKMRPLVPGFTNTPTTTNTSPEESFVRSTYPMPQQRPPPPPTMQLGQASLENMIQQLLCEQRQLVSRINHLESNLTALSNPQAVSMQYPPSSRRARPMALKQGGSMPMTAPVQQQHMMQPLQQQNQQQERTQQMRQMPSPMYVHSYQQMAAAAAAGSKMSMMDRPLFYTMSKHVS